MGDALRGADVRLSRGDWRSGTRARASPAANGAGRGDPRAGRSSASRPATSGAASGRDQWRRLSASAIIAAAQAAAPLELDRVAVRVVADRQAGAGAKAGVERKRDGRRPAHGRPVAAQARLAVRAHGEEAPALLDRARAIGERLLARLPRLHLRRGQPEVVVLVEHDGLVRCAGACARTRAAGRGGTRRRRRAGTSRRPRMWRARLMEHPAAQARLREVDRVPAEQAHPLVPRRQVAHDRPRSRPRCRCRTRGPHRPRSEAGSRHWPTISASSRTGSKAWNLIRRSRRGDGELDADRSDAGRASSKPSRSAMGSRSGLRSIAAGRAGRTATRPVAAADPTDPAWRRICSCRQTRNKATAGRYGQGQRIRTLQSSFLACRRWRRPCVAIDARHVMTHGQIRLEPDREARRIALQGVVRLLVHVAEERREAGELQIDLTPHGGAAIGIGRDVATAALVSRRAGRSPQSSSRISANETTAASGCASSTASTRARKSRSTG